MKRMFAVAMIVGIASLGLFGCMEKKASTKSETKITTPGGTTTVTTDREVKTTGDNPPPARP